MRIRVRSSRRRYDRITLNLASMIDVTFLLLAYFMMTMVIEAREDHLSPTLQAQTESVVGEASDFQPQQVDVLVIDGAPAYRLGERVMRDRAALEASLEQLPKSIGVFINVHEGVSVEFAVAAIQIARDARFEQVT